MTDAPATAADPHPVPAFDPAAVVSTDWARMTHAERGPALAACVAGWRRLSLPVQWAIGRGLSAHKTAMPGAKGAAEWRAYLAEIDMHPRKARRLIRLANQYRSPDKLSDHGTVDAALRAVATTKPAPVVDPAPGDPPAVVPEVVDPEDDDGDAGPEVEPEDAVTEAAREAEPDPAAVREARLERLAIRTEGVDGEVVEAWAGKLDTADERHRADVTTINAERRKRAALERRLGDIRDALLTVCGPNPAVDDLLARFFSCQRGRRMGAA